MAEAARRTRTDYLMLAGFCGFLFFFGLSYFGLVGADEPRYAQVAREMLERHDWITPTLGGRPWLEKPVLYYWQAMLAYSLFGVSDWAARIPAAFDATVMVLAVYVFLRRLRPGFHLDGALICASCAGVVGYARAASMDMGLTAAFTIAMLAWYAWYEQGSRLSLAAAYVFLGLATLAKGPVALFLALAVVLVFAWTLRDRKILSRSLWLPGIALFGCVTLPWYALVQARNPEFFREFIVGHNLARFSTNLYHHSEPFWYYLPVILLGLLPWTAFVVAAALEAVRVGWAERGRVLQPEDEFNVFLLLWLAVPLVFFSLSRSKLPGYIVPAIPAGALLLAEYIRRRVLAEDDPPRWVFGVHSLVAASLLLPALVIQYLVLQKRFPWGKGAAMGAGAALLVAVFMTITLARARGLRLVRFVTLVPVVLTVAALLRIGGTALDAVLSARPLARELSAMETVPLPLAVLSVSRETAYGLAFYRNQVIAHYEWGEVPSGEHIVVAPEGAESTVASLAGSRRVSYLGSYAPQHLDYFWVSAPGAQGMMHMDH
jgi:4-amino-4-deoxy-L-arabinose transferase-like glycosyltransferase